MSLNRLQLHTHDVDGQNEVVKWDYSRFREGESGEFHTMDITVQDVGFQVFFKEHERDQFIRALRGLADAMSNGVSRSSEEPMQLSLL